MLISSYLRPITLCRAANLLRARANYFLSKVGLYRFNHYPTFLSVEPADYCMLRCPQCPVGMTNNTEHHILEPTVLTQIINQVGQYIHTIIFYFQGEPLLNPQLPEMIKIAHDSRLFTMLSTNGMIMSRDLAEKLIEAHLDKIIISIDGLTQESYELYRIGGNLQKAVNAVKYISRIKKEKHIDYPEIEVQCLMLKSNENEWHQMQKAAKNCGADKFSLKTTQFYDYENGNPLMPTNTKYSRYKKTQTGKYKLKKTLKNQCWRLWSGAVVDVKGNILPCCYDKNREYIYGSINNFSQAWHSAEADKFRRQIILRRNQIDICRNCNE